MRPPYGANDRVSTGHGPGPGRVFWNLDTLDWKYQDTDRLVDYVLSSAGGTRWC